MYFDFGSSLLLERVPRRVLLERISRDAVLLERISWDILLFRNLLFRNVDWFLDLSSVVDGYPGESLGQQTLEIVGPLDGEEQEFDVYVGSSFVHQLGEVLARYVAKVHGYAFRDFPVTREDHAELGLKVQEVLLNPSISSIDFVKPGKVLVLAEQVGVFAKLHVDEPGQEVFPEAIE